MQEEQKNGVTGENNEKKAQEEFTPAPQKMVKIVMILATLASIGFLASQLLPAPLLNKILMREEPPPPVCPSCGMGFTSFGG